MAKSKKKVLKVNKKVIKKNVSKKSAEKKVNAKKPQSKSSSKKSAGKKVQAKVKPSKVAKRTVVKTSAKKAVVKASTKKILAKKISVKKASQAKNSTNDSVMKKKNNKIFDTFLTPLDDRLLIVLEGASDRTPGGLYIPETVEKDRPQKGSVVAVGRGHLDKKGKIKPLDVKVGEMVLFNKYSGQTVEFGDQELLLLRESEVLGVCE